MTSQLVDREVVAAIDHLIDRPVLVVGSLPPAGHDLDLLARRPERQAIERWLGDSGFLPWDGRWARTTDDTFNVDLVARLPWSHALDESRLYQGAEPLPGYTHLCQPAPDVQLLLAARSLVRQRWRLTAKNRGRVGRALARDPDAWGTAAELARSCGAEGALRFLHSAYDQDADQSPLDRVLGAWRTAIGRRSPRARLLLLRQAAPRLALPLLVTFSGLDGSGKTTQVERLSATMRQLGLPVAARRSGFKSGYRVRDALFFLDSRPGSATPADADPLMPSLCARTALGRHAWVTVVALVNAIGSWTLLLADRRARLVVVDRYAADAAVKLELFYGAERATRPRVQQRLLAALAPRPLLSFYVDVDPETALVRRPTENPQRIFQMKPMYDALAPLFGLIRLDGHWDASDLAGAVATAVWRELGQRSRR
jgi:hypothetical protein